MIPLKDDLPTRSTPVVTVLLMALNVLVFLYQASLEIGGPGGGAGAGQAFAMEFGLIPCRLTGACRTAGDLPSPVFTIFSSMFLHGSFFHIAGNMLYLWIFGNNVEDTLGHGRFTVFYLASGVAAAATQTWWMSGRDVPMIGASGAISGVLGAYLLLFPHANVLTLVIFGFFWRIVQHSRPAGPGLLDGRADPERTRLVRRRRGRGLVRPYRRVLRGDGASPVASPQASSTRLVGSDARSNSGLIEAFRVY